MPCPECNCTETTSDGGELFCKRCGLELGELITTSKGKSFMQDLNVSRLSFIIDPKQELFALKLGLKTGQLIDDWQNILRFSLNQDFLPSELKEKAQIMIEKAFDKNSSNLMEAKIKIEQEWNKISSKFFIELENLTQFVIEDNYQCYLSLIAKNGFHNTSQNFIILNSNLGAKSNYSIAHELFFIHFRNYIKKFFKEPFDKSDEEIGEILAVLVLQTHPKIKECFPGTKYSIENLSEDKKQLAKQLLPIWKSRVNFKLMMIEIYTSLDIEKKWISY